MVSKNGNTLLHWIARTDSQPLNPLLALLTKYCDVNAVEKIGRNPATVAFNSGAFQTWSWLVRKGAIVQSNFYSKDQSLRFLIAVSDGSTMTKHDFELFNQNHLQKLMHLIPVRDVKGRVDIKQNLQILDELVRHGANPNGRGSAQWICAMAKENLIPTFGLWIVEHALDINEPDDNGDTPLMLSIRHDLFVQTRFLLDKGANPNVQTTSPTGTIKRAVFERNTAISSHYNIFYELLRNFGADFTVEDENGNTVLNRALATKGNVRVAELATLVSVNKPNHNNITPLATGIINNSSINDLIAAGADVNAGAGPLLQPPLLLAIERCNIDAVCLLLDTKRVDITIKDKANRSLVYYLLTVHKSFLRQFNLESGIPKFYFTQQNTEFIKKELAVLWAIPELAKLKTNFMKRALQFLPKTKFVKTFDIDLNMEDSNGDTMLTLCARIIAKSANFDVGLEENDEDSEDDTMTRMDKEVVDFLLTNGADVNHQNKQKNTALMILAEMTKGKNSALKAKLIAAGASLTIKNIWGLTALDIEPGLSNLAVKKK